MARVPGLGPRRPKILKAQPGQGAPTGGTGRDQDGGKERGEFEKERQRERGTGVDRPPIYTPKDDGERGGYVNRMSPTGKVTAGKKYLPVIDKRTVKQKLADASRRRS